MADLEELADKLATINAPDQGMSYHGGRNGEQRYDERTGARYWTRTEPATLTVYGERARILLDIIQRGPEIAAAIRALSRTQGNQNG